MCGIVSLLAGSTPVTVDSLERAMAALDHRGPDGRGLWREGSGRVGLGHTRLAVVDPEGGAQPLASEDGRIQAVVNGELYGDVDLRRRLKDGGHRFRTASDSELVVHLYEDHGDAFVDHLHGEFALVLWDDRKKRLVAARDRFGIKPLCWARAPDGLGLGLASEAKALFAAGWPAAWDLESLFQSLSWQYTLPDRTLFSGIHQLPPGHMLVAEDGRVTVKSYWNLDYPTDRRATDPKVGLPVDELRELLEKAVAERLRGDVPVCVHLSGGLDSSTVLALASRHTGAPIDAFTVSFPGSSFDERPLAELTARRFGARLNVVEVTADQLMTDLPEAVACSEGLAANGHLVGKFRLSSAIRAAGYKVALTGEGADEVFAGYPHLIEDMIRVETSDPNLLERALARLHATHPGSAGLMLGSESGLSLSAARERLGHVPSYLRAKATFGLGCHALLSRDFLESRVGDETLSRMIEAVDPTGQLDGRHVVDRSLVLWTRTTLSQYILRTLGDGAEMAHSVEGRLPFLDTKLFEFARSLPPSWKVCSGTGKHILREATRDLVPEVVRTGRKHPFVAPPTSVRGPDDSESAMELALRATPWSDLGFVDPAAMEAMASRLPTLIPSQRALIEPVLMTFLSAHGLQRAFGL